MERIVIRGTGTVFALVLVAALEAPAEGAPGRTQTTVIPFPRSGEASIGLSNGPLTIHSVTLENRPDVEEVRDARSDRRDTKLLRWVFHVSNTGARDWHARVRVTVLDASGRRLGRNDRWTEVDARDFHDRVTVFTRIKTIAYPTADHVQVRADFYRY
jgi:hypothetical protein